MIALSDGLFRFEFFETVDDAPGSPDGRWTSGHLFFPTGLSTECEGGADLDGDTDFADITSVLQNWGRSYTGVTGPGDTDRDSFVDFDDITAVLQAWGNVCR